MQKQAPSIGRILVAVGFTLSCFGLILFLWIAFGGPIPLKPESYRITAYFPEATQLALESDVRIGGVSVGKVKEIELAPPDAARQRQGHDRGRDRDRARVRADLRGRAGDPAPEDAARRDLRRAHLGHRARASRRRRSRSAPRRTSPTPRRSGSSRSPRAAPSASARPRRRPRSTRSSTPSTRRPGPRSSAGRRTRRSRSRAAGSTSTTRSATSGPFLTDASDVHRRCSSARRRRSRGWCATPGPTFEALTARDQELAGVIVGSRQHLRRRSPHEDAGAGRDRSRSCRPSSASRG